MTQQHMQQKHPMSNPPHVANVSLPNLHIGDPSARGVKWAIVMNTATPITNPMTFRLSLFIERVTSCPSFSSDSSVVCCDDLVFHVNVV
jgi:hypothetical protein